MQAYCMSLYISFLSATFSFRFSQQHHSLPIIKNNPPRATHSCYNLSRSSIRSGPSCKCTGLHSLWFTPHMTTWAHAAWGQISTGQGQQIRWNRHLPDINSDSYDSEVWMFDELCWMHHMQHDSTAMYARAGCKEIVDLQSFRNIKLCSSTIECTPHSLCSLSLSLKLKKA